jgi:hypothetical protein
MCGWTGRACSNFEILEIESFLPIKMSLVSIVDMGEAPLYEHEGRTLVEIVLVRLGLPRPLARAAAGYWDVMAFYHERHNTLVDNLMSWRLGTPWLHCALNTLARRHGITRVGFRMLNPGGIIMYIEHRHGSEQTVCSMPADGAYGFIEYGAYGIAWQSSLSGDHAKYLTDVAGPFGRWDGKIMWVNHLEV